MGIAFEYIWVYMKSMYKGCFVLVNSATLEVGNDSIWFAGELVAPYLYTLVRPLVNDSANANTFDQRQRGNHAHSHVRNPTKRPGFYFTIMNIHSLSR